MEYKPQKRDGSTHGRKASDWSDPHQAPPIQLSQFKNWQKELDDFEQDLKQADPWSEYKTHLMTLVAMIACKDDIPLSCRARASAMIRSNVDDPIVSGATGT